MNCHTVQGTAATGRFGPDLTHLMSRDTLASGMIPNTRDNLRQWIKDPEHYQARIIDAGHAVERGTTRPGHHLPGNAEIERTMADQTLPIHGSLDLTPPRERESTLARNPALWVITVDHKKLGLMYMMLSIFFLLVGGAEVLLIRIQLAVPNNHFLSPQVFNRLFTMHGTTMVFLVGMPLVFAWANYIIPLQIGARDMAFPRLNAFSFWLTAFGALLLYFSFLGGAGLYGMGNAPDVTWWAYAPLTARGLLARKRHRLLGSRASRHRIRNPWRRNQYHRHCPFHAVQRHDADAHAALLMAHVRGQRALCSSPLRRSQPHRSCC